MIHHSTCSVGDRLHFPLLQRNVDIPRLQVVVRVKCPFSDLERMNYIDRLSFQNNQTIRFGNEPACSEYTYDKVYQADDNENVQFFHDTVEPLIHQSLDRANLNTNIWLYGETNSGKRDCLLSATNGLIPRTLAKIFKTTSLREKNDQSSRYIHDVKITLTEMYKKETFDLFLDESKTLLGTPEKDDRPEFSNIRTNFPERKKESELSIKNLDDAMSYLKHGLGRRRSYSGSHVVFTLLVHQMYGDFKVNNKIRFVELASPQHDDSSLLASGSAFRDRCAVNTSLMSLGNVMRSWWSDTENKRNDKILKFRVSHRDSLLTKSLSADLDANSNTVLIACIYPQANEFEKCQNVLRFAYRIKSLKSKASACSHPCNNEDVDFEFLSQLLASAGIQSNPEPLLNTNTKIGPCTETVATTSSPEQKKSPSSHGKVDSTKSKNQKPRKRGKGNTKRRVSNAQSGWDIIMGTRKSIISKKDLDEEDIASTIISKCRPSQVKPHSSPETRKRPQRYSTHPKNTKKYIVRKDNLKKLMSGTMSQIPLKKIVKKDGAQNSCLNLWPETKKGLARNMVAKELLLNTINNSSPIKKLMRRVETHHPNPQLWRETKKALAKKSRGTKLSVMTKPTLQRFSSTALKTRSKDAYLSPTISSLLKEKLLIEKEIVGSIQNQVSFEVVAPVRTAPKINSDSLESAVIDKKTATLIKTLVAVNQEELVLFETKITPNLIKPSTEGTSVEKRGIVSRCLDNPQTPLNDTKGRTSPNDMNSNFEKGNAERITTGNDETCAINANILDKGVKKADCVPCQSGVNNVLNDKHSVVKGEEKYDIKKNNSVSNQGKSSSDMTSNERNAEELIVTSLKSLKLSSATKMKSSKSSSGIKDQKKIGANSIHQNDTKNQTKLSIEIITTNLEQLNSSTSNKLGENNILNTCSVQTSHNQAVISDEILLQSFDAKNDTDTNKPVRFFRHDALGETIPQSNQSTYSFYDLLDKPGSEKTLMLSNWAQSNSVTSKSKSTSIQVLLKDKKGVHHKSLDINQNLTITKSRQPSYQTTVTRNKQLTSMKPALLNGGKTSTIKIMQQFEMF